MARGLVVSIRRPRQLVGAAALALVAVLVLSSGVGAGRRDSSGTFRLDDGSVGCRAWPAGAIACRARGMREALVLERDGRSRVVTEMSGPEASAPILLGGETWRHGRIVCRAGEREVVCSTADGGQITVGARGIGALLPPAQLLLARP